MEKLNEVGIGKFDFKETEDTIIFMFDGHEVGVGRKNHHVAYIGQTPLLTNAQITYILTSLLCCAIIIKLFGKFLSETLYIWIKSQNKAIIYPVFDEKSAGNYIITVPAFNLDTDVRSYKIKITPTTGQNVSLQIHPKDLPNNDMLNLAISAMMI